MLGSNLSTDSVASTDDRGDASASPFFIHPQQAQSGEASSDKSWGCGGKAPARYPKHPSFLLRHGRSLIMHFRLLMD